MCVCVSECVCVCERERERERERMCMLCVCVCVCVCARAQGQFCVSFLVKHLSCQCWTFTLDYKQYIDDMHHHIICLSRPCLRTSGMYSHTILFLFLVMAAIL